MENVKIQQNTAIIPLGRYEELIQTEKNFNEGTIIIKHNFWMWDVIFTKDAATKEMVNNLKEANTAKRRIERENLMIKQSRLFLTWEEIFKAIKNKFKRNENKPL